MPLTKLLLTKLRFGPGERVDCKLGTSGRWCSGTITSLRYRKDHWDADRFVRSR
jgi:hypothetical protein